MIWPHVPLRPLWLTRLGNMFHLPKESALLCGLDDVLETKYMLHYEQQLHSHASPQSAEQWYSFMIILMINFELYLRVKTPIYIIKVPKKKRLKTYHIYPQGTRILQTGREELESQAQHFLKWLCINSVCAHQCVCVCMLQMIYIFSA